MYANFKKAACLVLALLTVSASLVGCNKEGSSNTADTTDAAATSVPETTPKEELSAITLKIREINKHGNVILETSFDELKEYNIEVGDIVTVTAGENSYDMPVGTLFSDVDSGNPICRFDTDDNEVSVAINMGNFATTAGIGEKQEIEEDPGYKWDIKVEAVAIVLKEKQGYMAEYTIRNLVRTDERSDYADLTDEEFANFREVATTGIKSGVLYRSATPIEPALGRNEYAMAAMEKAGIKSVINLDDDKATMEGYETYEGSYYSGCNILNVEMLYDFTSAEFGQRVKECIEFIIESEGPVLIHCKEGKDRTGVLCAILEAYMGGDLQEIVDDYMLTFKNFYGVEEGSETYNLILSTNIVKTFSGIYQVSNPLNVDLKANATRFLLSIGLTEEQLEALSEKIGDDGAEQNTSGRDGLKHQQEDSEISRH